MFRLRLLSLTGVLVFGIAISLSQSQDEEKLFAKAYQQTRNQLNPSAPRFALERSSQNRPDSLKPSTDKTPSTHKPKRNDTLKSAAASTAQTRQYGEGWGWGGGHGHGWGGWGRNPHQYHYYQPSYGSDNKLLLLGALAGLGLLAALGFFMFNRTNGNSVVFVNSSGRRRRSVDDFDDGLDGETMSDLMSRITGYIESAWTGESTAGKKLEIFQLPRLD